ncbi:MAG TPA: SsrA-binding protein SmpB [Candidatus Obscuribacterales bacterium]
MAQQFGIEMAPAKQQQKTEKKKPAPQGKVIADNRRARHEYEIIEVFEAGMELQGTEVKSMRNGKANLQDAFARIEEGQLWLHNCHIAPYDFGNRFNHDPVRKRRLLMHKREITRLHQQIKEKGLTLIPLKLYFKRNWVKVDLALVRGKHLYDKRDAITKRDSKRQLDRLVKESYRNK